MGSASLSPAGRGPPGTARWEGGRGRGGSEWGWGTGDRGLDLLRLDVVILVHKLLTSIPPVARGISLPLHFPIHSHTHTHQSLSVWEPRTQLRWDSELGGQEQERRWRTISLSGPVSLGIPVVASLGSPGDLRHGAELTTGAGIGAEVSRRWGAGSVFAVSGRVLRGAAA